MIRHSSSLVRAEAASVRPVVASLILAHVCHEPDVLRVTGGALVFDRRLACTSHLPLVGELILELINLETSTYLNAFRVAAGRSRVCFLRHHAGADVRVILL